MKYAFLIILVQSAILMAALPAVAQTCTATVPAATPYYRFVDNNDGTVTDAVTGLVWKRCSEGQTWNGATCTGTAGTYTWAQALAQGSANNSFAGKSDWRLPNLKELDSIVESQCVSPAINTAIFPATPPSGYWTGSTYAGSPNGSWVVYFDSGNFDGAYKTYVNVVRLVRSGQ